MLLRLWLSAFKFHFHQNVATAAGPLKVLSTISPGTTAADHTLSKQKGQCQCKIFKRQRCRGWRAAAGSAPRGRGRTRRPPTTARRSPTPAASTASFCAGKAWPTSGNTEWVDPQARDYILSVVCCYRHILTLGKMGWCLHFWLFVLRWPGCWTGTRSAYKKPKVQKMNEINPDYQV